MSQTHYELYRDAAGEWRWRFVAANGETVAVSSEGYENRADARTAIERVKESGRIDAPVEADGGDDG